MTTYLPLTFACASLVLWGYLHVYRSPSRVLRGLGLSMLALTVGLYLLLGTPLLPSYPHHERTALFAPHADNADTPSLTDSQLRALIMQAEEKVRAEPQEPLAWQMLARSWLMVEEVVRAQKTLRDGIDRFPDSVALISDAASLTQQQNAPDAVVLWQRLLRLAPQHPQALWFLALHQQAQGNNDKARTLLNRLIDTNPNNQKIIDAAQNQLDNLPAP